MRIQGFDWTFPGMRKPDNLLVLPREPDGTYVFQGNRTIGRVHPTTRLGVLNYRGSNSKYFAHLNAALGAVKTEFPQEFVNRVREFAPSHGDQIGPGAYLA